MTFHRTDQLVNWRTAKSHFVTMGHAQGIDDGSRAWPGLGRAGAGTLLVAVASPSMVSFSAARTRSR